MRPLIEFTVIMFKWFCFLFLKRWPILSRQFDCFGKLAVTVALPLAVFELISITASLGDFRLSGRFFSLLVGRFVSLWLSKTLN